MGIWKDKDRQDWCYDFIYHKQRYASRGFKFKKEAETARVIRRQELKFLYDALPKQEQIDLTAVADYFSFLKEKYKAFLTSPENTLPDLVDMVFADFELPYTYKHIKQIALNSKRAKLSVRLRTQILKRDQHKCVLCGNGPPAVSLQVDHIIPVSKGGLTEDRNLRTLCRDCNLGKNDMPQYITG